jgi:diaminohydroxyphosphoribosylaminopyrimidine deaminase / 5-amino-6-(5-phosphoribosylamino)uracil reductase
VLTGIGTVLQDDPRLDVRHVAAPRQPHLVIVDSKLETPLDAQLFSTLGKVGVAPETAIKPDASPAVLASAQLNFPLQATNSPTARAIYIYAAVPNPAKKTALEALGATVVYLPESNAATAANPQDSKVDLAAMLRDLAQREINVLHVEAGFKLNGSLLKAWLVDELLIYTAPKLLGPGMGIANLPALAALGDAVQLDFQSADLVGPDLRVLARLRGRDTF